ncbi:hypothetical protein HDK77DRAFT_499945 [Phyllosticta capitalensis]
MVAAEGKDTLVTCIIVTVVACIVVALRLYSRLVLVGGVGWDDLIITSSLILIIVLAVVASQQVRHGLGKHVWENPPEETATLFKYVFASIIIYLISLCLTKLSILLQYLRIFGTQPAMRIACFATIAFVVTYTFVAGGMNIFNCKPIHYFWSRALDPTGGSCLDFEAVWFTHAGINIFSDFLMIVLPMPVLRSLKIHRRQKVALMAIFAFGSFGGVTAILRLKSLARVSKSNDVTYDNTGALLWSTVECNVAIMCASLPSLKVLVSRYFPHLLSTIGSGSRSNPASGRYARSGRRSWRFGSGSRGLGGGGGGGGGLGGCGGMGSGTGGTGTTVTDGSGSDLYGLKQLSDPASHGIKSPHLYGTDKKPSSKSRDRSRRKSAVKTQIAKARSRDGLEDEGSSDESGNIKVTTVMSQQRERTSSYFSAHEGDGGLSEGESMAESERRFFRRVP